MLCCSIWFSAPSFWMGGGLESRRASANNTARLLYSPSCERQNCGIEGLQSAGNPATSAVVRDTITGTRQYNPTLRRLLKPHSTIRHDNEASSRYYKFSIYAHSSKCQSQRVLFTVLHPFVACRRKSLCRHVWIAQRILKCSKHSCIVVLPVNWQTSS